jgi:uncharacterized protein YfaS (alpha-2-macroglobulin family)
MTVLVCPASGGAFGCRALMLAVLAFAAIAAPASAQPSDADERAAFTLSSSEVFTTHDSPFFYLTFRRIPQLDFRVYKVRDPFTFFRQLKDPHQLGSDEPYVPQERSWIERIADWKARQRSTIRSFLRAQVSRAYRAERRASQDQAVVAQRVALQVNTFAQVPLLNPDQLVTSWREVLPNNRDSEMRRVPLEVKEPGVYLVEAVQDLLRAYTIVIVSDVGMVTKVSPGQLVMFAANRFSGEPVAGCDVQVMAGGTATPAGATSADGLVEHTLPGEKADNTVGVARCGDQVAATDPGSWYLEGSVRQLVGYIYTDKPIYRPGHRVHVKAVLRWRERDALQPFDRPQVELAASDLNDKVIFRQSLAVDEFGAVQASFAVPATAALGIYSLRIASGDEVATGAFEVQEYRKPEFEVIVTPQSRFVVQGEEAVATVQARYYFGQPVANARVRYVVNQQPYYSPLRFSDGFEGTESTYWYGSGDQREEGELRLDANGQGEIRVPLTVDDNGRDFSARIEAQVTDASSREVSGNTTVHATYGPFLVAAQTRGYVFKPGGRVEADIRTVTYTGEPRANVPVTAILERITYAQGYYGEPTATRIAEATARTDAKGTATAALTLPNASGSFRIRVTTTVDERELTGQTWVWVPGAQETAFEGDRFVELIADRRSYQPGDTARLMLRGDTVSGPILVTKEGQHVTWYRVLRPAASDAIEVPIEAGDVGDTYINVSYMREGRLYRAERRISVPPTDRTLQITLTANQAVSKPQEPGLFTVNVTDAAGAPVQAQLSLGVIDEAVYGVKPDETPDPARFFYTREYSRVGTVFSREYNFTGYSGNDRLQLASRKRRPYTLADFKGDKQPQPEVRKDFPDAIYWIADLVTDAQGRATVSIRYPDALTTWRLTARAVTKDTLVGAAVTRTTTTKDLIVRVITPRFLTEGDEVVLPTLVHNYRPDPRAADVSIDVTGLSPAGDTTAPRASSGALASGAERRDDWRYAAPTVGTARVTARAKTETDTDAVELPVPVLPYGLHREALASGSMNGATEQKAELTVPATSNPAGRLVTVQLAPSLAGSLLGAVDYLTGYPYGCTEQTLSSFLPNVLVTRTLTQLGLAPTERLSALDRQVSDGLRRLADYQHDDGGWGWWKTDENHPFMTAYALYGLVEARGAGYKADEWRISNGTRALAQMYAQYPRAEPDLKAYMAYVLTRATDGKEPITWYAEGAQAQYDHAAARDELWNARSRMSTYGRALLLLVLDAVGDLRGTELATSLSAEAETRGELSWWQSDNDPLLFDSVETSVEATAFAVQALVKRDPRNPLVERAVRWLILNRTGGYWSSTKQTAMALYGLLEFLKARNEKPQPVTVDVFVNGALAGTQAFTAASITAPDPVSITAPAQEGANAVRLVTRGDGPVYWSAAATYYDTAAAAERSGTRQLAITRRYAKLRSVQQDANQQRASQQRSEIVYREEEFDGTAAPGDVLTVRLTVAGSKDWRYLVLEDPLPAGVEAVQDTTAYPLERGRPGAAWWTGSRVEYRDSRTVFFQESFEDGRYEFVYLVKVISSGQFRAIPAQIAPMYVPGVTASSEPQTLTVTLPAEGAK